MKGMKSKGKGGEGEMKGEMKGEGKGRVVGKTEYVISIRNSIKA